MAREPTNVGRQRIARVGGEALLRTAARAVNDSTDCINRMRTVIVRDSTLRQQSRSIIDDSLALLYEATADEGDTEIATSRPAFGELFAALPGSRRLAADELNPAPAGPGIVIVARDVRQVPDGASQWEPVDVLCVGGEMLTLAQDVLAACAMGSSEVFFAWLVPIQDRTRRQVATDALLAAMPR